MPTGRFVATNLAVLINASGTGTHPVRNLSIVGIEFRDTRATFMDPHGLPSGQVPWTEIPALRFKPCPQKSLRPDSNLVH